MSNITGEYDIIDMYLKSYGYNVNKIEKSQKIKNCVDILIGEVERIKTSEKLKKDEKHWINLPAEVREIHVCPKCNNFGIDVKCQNLSGTYLIICYNCKSNFELDLCVVEKLAKLFKYELEIQKLLETKNHNRFYKNMVDIHLGNK